MKKLLITTLSITLLLGACGDNTEKSNDNTKQNSKTTNKQASIVDYYHKYANQTVDELYNLMNYLYKTDPEDVSEEEAISKFTKSANELEKHRTKFKNDTKNMKIPSEYKEPIKTFNSINQGATEGIRIISDALNNYLNDKISEEEFDKQISLGEERFSEYTDDKIDDDEVLKTLNKKTKDKIEKLTDLMDKEESLANESNEFTDDDEDNDTNQSDSMYIVDDFKEVKSEDITYTQAVGSLNVNFNEMKTYTVKVTDDNEYLFENYEIGETAYILGIDLELENTSETPTDYYIDQAEIVTNNQEQIEPSLISPKKNIKTELKGNVKSSGIIYYELETSNSKDLDWLDFVLPAKYDDDTMDVEFEEKKLRLEF
ncbi:hypothetical protein [Mammaliicoccus lentus]|uniref:DUF4352 domain-containing protein n=1 Tax=Mammaliicoccus lentus TaxID=42858 RepID=A0ABS6GVY9_MAMLE|nr:hypothetical protein [Mammaliicoccus lentus]MBU6112491.1 hypothetical protein [Mammaliicoccus lentus]